MIALWILLGFFALLWLLMAMPLRIFLTYRDDELDYRLKYGPFCLADSKKPPKEKPKEVSERASKKPEKKKKSGMAGKLLDFLGFSEISSIANAKKSIAKSGIVGTVSAVFASIKKLFARIGKLVKKGVFKKFHLSIIVADGDAADAALLYGQICAVGFPMLEYLEHSIKIKNENVDIRCDYETEETRVSFDGQLNYRPWHFVCFFMGLVGNYIKRLVKKEN